MNVSLAYLKDRIKKQTAPAYGFLNAAIIEKLALAEITIWMNSQSDEVDAKSVLKIAQEATAWVYSQFA